MYAFEKEFTWDHVIRVVDRKDNLFEKLEALAFLHCGPWIIDGRNNLYWKLMEEEHETIISIDKEKNIILVYVRMLGLEEWKCGRTDKTFLSRMAQGLPLCPHCGEVPHVTKLSHPLPRPAEDL